MAKRTAMANGKTVKRSGNLPDAKMGKAQKIHDGKNRRKADKVRAMLGGVVRATSHNYGMKGAKGRELRGAALGFEDED